MTTSQLSLHQGRPRGPHRKLNPQVVQTAGMMAMKGISDRLIARAVGVNVATFSMWKARGRTGLGSDLERHLYEAMSQGQVYGALQLISVAENHAKVNFNACRWLLERSPKFRADYAENSKAESDVLKVLNCVVEAIDEQPFLDQDQKQALLLAIQARCGAMDAEDFDD